jgi:glycosyltransferase involved in cell wall biosynthesis
LTPSEARNGGPITVGLDATPLIGDRTGIGVATAGMLRSVSSHTVITAMGYGLTSRGWRRLTAVLPPAVRMGSRWPMPAGPLLRSWKRFDWPTVERWTGPLDVVHGTNFVVPPTRRAARVVTVHDLASLHFPELCTPTARRYPDLIRRAVRTGATVHVATQFGASEVTDAFGAPEDRVAVIPFGVDPPSLPPAKRADRAPYVLGLGTAEPRKDLPLLVAAFDALATTHPDLELHLAGSPGWGEEALQAAVANASHRDRIRRLGWVADTGALIAGASVLAYPSLYEGFGFPPLEAMARGVPVVATIAGALPEVLGGAARLVAVHDRDALTGALDDVLSRPEEAQRLSDAGLRRVAALPWSATGDSLVELYTRLAS